MESSILQFDTTDSPATVDVHGYKGRPFDRTLKAREKNPSICRVRTLKAEDIH